MKVVVVLFTALCSTVTAFTPKAYALTRGYWVGEGKSVSRDQYSYPKWHHPTDTFDSFSVSLKIDGKVRTRNFDVFRPADQFYCSTHGNTHNGAGKCGEHGNTLVYSRNMNALRHYIDTVAKNDLQTKIDVAAALAYGRTPCFQDAREGVVSYNRGPNELLTEAYVTYMAPFNTFYNLRGQLLWREKIVYQSPRLRLRERTEAATGITTKYSERKVSVKEFYSALFEAWKINNVAPADRARFSGPSAKKLKFADWKKFREDGVTEGCGDLI